MTEKPIRIIEAEQFPGRTMTLETSSQNPVKLILSMRFAESAPPRTRVKCVLFIPVTEAKGAQVSEFRLEMN